MSISSIGIQTVTPSTGTRTEQPPPQQQQQSAANDNTTQVAAKSGSSSPAVGQHVDKRV